MPLGDGYIRKPDLFEVTLSDQTLGELEHTLDGDSGKYRIKGGMAKHALFRDKGDIHVGALCDHAALIDEHTVVGAVILGFQHD